MVYLIDDFPHQGLQFVNPVQGNSLDLVQAILLVLDLMYLITLVVESPLVEATHEGPENATDDRRREVVLDPVLFRRSEGGSRSGINPGQGSSEVVDGGGETTDVKLHNVKPGLNFCFQVSILLLLVELLVPLSDSLQIMLDPVDGLDEP